MGEYYKYSIKSLQTLSSIPTLVFSLPFFMKSFSLLQNLYCFNFLNSYGRFYIGSIESNKLIIEVILLT
jgi:hypothetical protein